MRILPHKTAGPCWYVFKLLKCWGEPNHCNRIANDINFEVLYQILALYHVCKHRFTEKQPCNLFEKQQTQQFCDENFPFFFWFIVGHIILKVCAKF